MTEYNFAAQYQQDPQPPSGNIVKKKWLKFYGPDDELWAKVGDGMKG
jgi:hypothetical protein